MPMLAAHDQNRAAAGQPFKRLWRMTAEQRIAAFYRGDLKMTECLAWARRFPQEVPKIGGEFAFLVARTPEYLGE
jgi:hypothetical protein